MLNHLLSLCLLTLLSAGQNCIPHTTDLGEGSLGLNNDVIHLNFSSGDPFRPAYSKRGDAVSCLYNAGGDLTRVMCHDLICENHTKTVIHAGACQGTSCAASFCREDFHSSMPAEAFVYHAPATQRTYAVVCNDTFCDGSVPQEVRSGGTSSLGCALDDQRRVLFAVPSYGISNMLFRCGGTCSSVESYFENPLGFQASRVVLDTALYIDVRPVMVFLRAGKGELYFATSYDFEGSCRCAFPMLLARDVVDTPFAASMQLYSPQWLQVSYMASQNGVASLYLVSCKINSGGICTELHTNAIDTLPFGDPPMPSISYGPQTYPVIAYRYRDAQGAWYVKVARCLDDTCTQADVSLLPQDEMVHAVSLAVNGGNNDLYVLYSVGQTTSRVKLYTCLESIATPYPSRNPSSKPTLTPSAPTPSPTPDPSLSPVFPTPAPTVVTDTPTSTPTDVPTKNPTPCRYPTVESGQKEKKNPCASKLTAVWVVNGVFALLNVIAAMYRYEWIEKWLYRRKDLRDMKNMAKDMT